MCINEMEFQWRLNWWYRPTQLDGFGLSVADYFDCFCDWKTNMELNSCPADEGDYVDAFIQNLRCDIQSRLPEYIFSGGLICAFLAAKLEESMMRVDEALKNIGAHKPFDEMPSQTPSCSQASPVSSQSPSVAVEDSCSTMLAINSLDSVVIADEESSGLENDEMSTLAVQSSGLENDEMSTLAVHILAPSPSNDQVLRKNDYDPLTGVVETRNADRDELINSIVKVGSDMESFSLNAGRKVFEEMPNQFSVKPTGGINRGECYILQINCVPRVFDPGTLISRYMHNELFNKLLQPSVIEPAGSESFSGQCHSISTFLGQCKPVPSYTSTHMVFIFDPGGCGEIFGFWIEGVVGTLNCRLLKCLVRCPWSHIISLVDEMKRAGIGNEECCKLFCLINGVAGSSWLGNGCDTINKRSNAFDSRDVRQHHNHFSANQGATFLREKMLDSTVCWPSDLRYEAGALGDISTKISPNS